MLSDAERRARLARTLAGVIHEWQPADHVCCENCGNARVSGDPAWPDVRCSQGHGDAMSLQRLIREGRVRSFRNARACKDFDDVDNE
jgi:hypothetical protein